MQAHEAITIQHSDYDYRRRAAVQLALKHVRGRSVLDMRCLEGDLMLSLLQNGKHVLALDGFAEAVDLANNCSRQLGFGTNHARIWGLRDLPTCVEGRQFESVICFDLLNHVESDTDILGEIAEVTSSGGQLLLLAPAIPSLLGPRDRFSRPLTSLQ